MAESRRFFRILDFTPNPIHHGPITTFPLLWNQAAAHVDVIAEAIVSGTVYWLEDGDRRPDPLGAEAQRQRAETGAEKVRLLGEAVYQAESWDHPRRVVIKAEALTKGPNTRFVVTTRIDPSEALYDWYVDRGEGENWSKDLKVACFADRLSDHRFWANQFRLLLHAATYWLLDTVRRWLAACAVPRMQLDTLRLSVLKIGGRVYQLTDRIRLQLASSQPGQPLWRQLAAYHRAHE